MSWLNIEKRVYVVTGGSSGIGDAIVKELIADGAYVVNADVHPGTYTHENLEFIQTDVTDPDSVQALVDGALVRFDHIDGVVNNAGINLPRLIVDAKDAHGKFELSLPDFQKLFAVNVQGVFLVTQAVLRNIVAQGGGVVINMSSEAGLEGSEGQSPYSASKGAVNGFTRSWAKELGKHNVRVVGVAPGILEATGLRTLAYEEALAYTRNITVEKLRAGYSSTSTTPLGRSGKLAEVGSTVAFLLSDQAGYITGVTINVAGGKSRG